MSLVDTKAPARVSELRREIARRDAEIWRLRETVRLLREALALADARKPPR